MLCDLILITIWSNRIPIADLIFHLIAPFRGTSYVFVLIELFLEAPLGDNEILITPFHVIILLVLLPSRCCYCYWFNLWKILVFAGGMRRKMNAMDGWWDGTLTVTRFNTVKQRRTVHFVVTWEQLFHHHLIFVSSSRLFHLRHVIDKFAPKA